jgi:hypothetical protein
LSTLGNVNFADNFHVENKAAKGGKSGNAAAKAHLSAKAALKGVC